MDWIGWATGPNARPRVTEAMPSEKGDALLAVQAIHRFYHRRSPNVGINDFKDHVRNYWADMIGDDTLDEGLTDFHPDYPNMTAGPVDAVPSDHLSALSKEGWHYDLGLLTDFCRDPPGALKAANWVEQDPPLMLPGPVKASEPPPTLESAPDPDPPSAPEPAPPPPPAPPPAPEPAKDSWWSFLVRAPSWDACFAIGTPVACPAGPRAIEELREGDEVLACDAVGALVVARVTRTLVHAPAPCLLLHVEGAAPIQLTANHPVLVRGEWRPAVELRPGDELRALEGRAVVKRVVIAIDPPGVPEKPVFDLTVADHHTFFAGTVLVHNKLP